MDHSTPIADTVASEKIVARAVGSGTGVEVSNALATGDPGWMCPLDGGCAAHAASRRSVSVSAIRAAFEVRSMLTSSPCSATVIATRIHPSAVHINNPYHCSGVQKTMVPISDIQRHSQQRDFHLLQAYSPYMAELECRFHLEEH